MATKLGRMVAYSERKPCMKSYGESNFFIEPLITRSPEVMKISSLQQDLQPPNLAGQQLIVRETHT